MTVLLFSLVIFSRLWSVAFLQVTVPVNVLTDDGVSLNGCQTGGPCSLRNAWSTCKILSTRVTDCTVKLPSGSEIMTNSSNGPLILEPSNNIKIVSGNSTIRSDGLRKRAYYGPYYHEFYFRLLYFQSDPSDTEAALSLDGLTVTGFGRLDINGGAIYANGNVKLSISNCNFTNNFGDNGGSIYVSSNIAGIHIANSHFHFVQAFSDGGALMAGVDVTGILVENSTFSNCTARYSGGAISLGENIVDFTLRGSAFVECLAESTFEGYGGGGLHVGSNNRNILIHNSRFMFNRAGSGGSMNIRYNNRNVSIVDVELDHETAVSSGGGIYVNEGNKNVNIMQVRASNLNSYWYGGAIGFQKQNTNVRIRHSLFENCTAKEGGTIYMHEGNSVMVVSNTTFRNSHATDKGGAIILIFDNHYMSLNDVTADNCTAGDGGGAFLELSANNNYAAITDSQVTNCSTTGDGGGIAAISSNRHMRVERTSFTACRSAALGGAIALIANNNNNFTLTHSLVENCSASAGGALAIESVHYGVFVHMTELIGNSAVEGGAIYSNAQTTQLTLSGSQFIANTATGDGGAVLLNGANNQFLISDNETAVRVQILETAHPFDCSEGYYVLDNYQDPGATSFLIQIDSRSAIEETSSFLIGRDLFGTYYSSNNLWPGVRLPRLMWQSVDVSVALICSPSSESLYGLRVIATPILTVPGAPTVFAFNKAGASGGAIAMPYAASFGLIANVQFFYNTAGTNGGAVAFGGGSADVMVRSSVFQENEAGVSGGAIFMGASSDSIDISECIFELNSAGDGGGALAMIYGNGATRVLVGGAVPKISRCTFSENSAELGGALYLDRENVAIVEHTVLRGNQALDAGGGIYAGTDNKIDLNKCIVERNAAAGAGGGVASEARNALVLNNVDVQNNSAASYGGAVYANSGTTVQISEYSSTAIMNNSAVVAGGGVASFASPLWDRGVNSTLLIVANTAQRGSALYLKALSDLGADDGQSSLRDMVIADNVATVGGTVYWLFDSDMTSEPEGVNSSSVVWEGNVALYGERVATQAIKMRGPVNYTVEVFGQTLDPPLEYGLQDLYGQEMLIRGPTVLTANIIDSFHSNCSGRTPFLSGNQEAVMNGTARFDDLEANCAPDGEINVEVTAALLDLTELASAGVLEHYAVAKAVKMTYRSCRRGEYIQDGQCVTCPTGTYSLEYPVTQDTECNDCTGKSGVATCYGDVIEVSGGYWRRHSTSEAVLDCLGDLNGCAGGESTGNALCEEGYEGPLCAVCADGYYSSNGICELCSGDTKLSITALVFVCIVGTAVIIATFTFYAKCLDSVADEDDTRRSVVAERGLQRYMAKSWWQQKFKDIQAQLKIVITTYQIVSSIPTNLIVDFPGTFTSFLTVFAVFNLNVISVVPFACTQHFTFIDKLVATTLFPIALSLLLTVLCAIDVAHLTYMRIYHGKDTDPHIKATPDQYLTYFFFLTYLVLPSVSTTIFQTFLCTNVDPRGEDNDEYDSYLIADMSISCTSSYYYRGVAYAAVMLLVYVVGIPFMYFLLLNRNRDEIAGRDEVYASPDAEKAKLSTVSSKLDREYKLSAHEPTKPELPSYVKRLAFLWDAYEPRFWYWEVVETTRRLMLTAVLSVCGAGTSAQSILAVLLGMLYIKLYGYFKPYEQDNDDVVAEVGQFQIFFTFLGALIYQNSLLGREWNDAVSVVLIVINGAVTVLFFYYGLLGLQEEWKERQEYFRLRKEQSGQEHPWEAPNEDDLELRSSEPEQVITDLLPTEEMLVAMQGTPCEIVNTPEVEDDVEDRG